jgi:hypothetical protein
MQLDDLIQWLRERWLRLRDAADERFARFDEARWRWSSDRLRRSADIVVVSLLAGGLLVLGLFAAAAVTDESSAGKLPAAAAPLKQKVVPRTITEKLPGKRLVRNRKVTTTETVGARASRQRTTTTTIAGHPTVVPLKQTVTVSDSKTVTVTQPTTVTQPVTVTEPVTVTQSVTVTVPPGHN